MFYSRRNWALHTRKWQEGQPTDISTWKTRFRCALTKLQDIIELNNMHQTEGDEPYRVYQFKKKGIYALLRVVNSGLAIKWTRMFLTTTELRLKI